MDRNYQIIKRPLITEKTTMIAENNTYAFEVLKDADKVEVKNAIEAIFNVKVEKVNILNQSGKTKRFRGKPGKRNDVRKAYVRLQEGQALDLTAGL
jgi:large subunit ribosomal protein L23|tara:strand:- start:193 stop:480 length:288 start_codon:yes stop_codon:yes gene_type:complete